MPIVWPGGYSCSQASGLVWAMHALLSKHTQHGILTEKTCGVWEPVGWGRIADSSILHFGRGGKLQYTVKYIQMLVHVRVCWILAGDSSADARVPVSCNACLLLLLLSPGYCALGYTTTANASDSIGTACSSLQHSTTVTVPAHDFAMVLSLCWISRVSILRLRLSMPSLLVPSHCPRLQAACMYCM